VRSMSTSEDRVPCGGKGFTLIELLVGLTLAATLAVTTMPIWVSLQSAGARETDRSVNLLQQRVALARFERDLRLASGRLSLFPTGGAVLEASDMQVVFLMPQRPGAPPVLVEWELAKGSLMRRWGPCPRSRPATYAHSLYSDSKTMVEGLGPGSGLKYVVAGTQWDGAVPVSELARVQAVSLELEAGESGARSMWRTSATAQVGR